VDHHRTRRGALIASLPGLAAGPERTLTGHVDTLGAMVKEIIDDGTMHISRIGSYALNSVEGEYCTIVTATGGRFRGTILLDKPSVHVDGKVGTAERTSDNMVIRLDAEVRNGEEIAKLGIAVGDWVNFDPRLEITPTGFVKTRHLDDKAGVACMLGAIRTLATAGKKPARTTHFYFSTSEEVGFGASSGIPEATSELIAVDMGAMGRGQKSDEYSVCICAQDSTGPFDNRLRQQLVKLCQQEKIPYQVDIYPQYGSDAAVAVRAGLDAVTGLIGPGIHASHSMERTHEKALDATVRLILTYVESEGNASE
jgi:putative aminopeptidase FrvX